MYKSPGHFTSWLKLVFTIYLILAITAGRSSDNNLSILAIIKSIFQKYFNKLQSPLEMKADISIKPTSYKIKRNDFKFSKLSLFKYFGIYFEIHYIPIFLKRKGEIGRIHMYPECSFL